MFTKGNKVLLICAHPDDEVLGCGGTLLKLKDIGCDIKIIFAFKSVFNDEQWIKIKEGAKNILSKNNFNDIVFLEYQCLTWNNNDILSLTKQLKDIMDQYKPDHIFTHNGKELHVDHNILLQSVKINLRYNNYLKSLLTFEVNLSDFDNKFQPNLYIDIKKYNNKKEEMLKSYLSILGEYHSVTKNNSLKSINCGSNYRGYQSLKEFESAEGFEILKYKIK